METFPAFFPLAGRRVVIAGDGAGAEAKARLFADSPAEVVRLAPGEALRPEAYAGAALIFVASYDAAFVEAAAAAARLAGAPLNVTDNPALSDFHTPAIIDRGQVVAAVGAAGAAPLLVSLLRAEVEARVPAGAGVIAALLGERREALRAAFPDLPDRRAFLRAVLAGPPGEAAAAGDRGLAAARLDAAIVAGWSALGRVSFIAAPREPDRLSLRAVRALNFADVVVSGDGVEAILASHARRDAERRGLVGADAETLAALAAAGRLVAVIAAGLPIGLAEAVAARGAAVEHLAPAP